MRKKNPSTGNNNTYTKEQQRHLKRIRSFVKSAEERGYIFFDRKVPTSLKFRTDVGAYAPPKTVKNPTAVTVKRLEKITVDYLYERAMWVDPETGAIHTAAEGRKIERSRAAQKGAATRRRKHKIQPAPQTPPYEAVFDRIRDYITHVQNVTTGWADMDKYKQARGRYLMDFFEDCLSAAEMEDALYEYSKYLDSKAEEISNIVDAIGLDSDRSTVDANVGHLLTILNQGPLTVGQSLDYEDAMNFGSYDEGEA